MPGISRGNPASHDRPYGRGEDRRTPAIVVASGWSRSGKSRKTAENTTGIKVPPENPCTMRQAISEVKLAAHGAGDRRTVNTETATTNNQRIVSSRVKNPVSGIAMISAIKYDVWIQLIWS